MPHSASNWSTAAGRFNEWLARGLGSFLLLFLACHVFRTDSNGQELATIVPRAAPHTGTSETASGLARPDIRVDTNLVLIPVTVTDPLGRFVTGLDRDSFKVFEDNTEQNVVSFGSDDAPITVGIVFDTSGSMGAKLERSRAAVGEFLKSANPEDEAFLIEFSDRPTLVTSPTRNMEEIENQLMFVPSKGHTALLDAVYLGLQTMKKASNPRKALLIISDGGDNNSRYTEREVLNLVVEADVQIYAIGIYEPVGSFGATGEEIGGPRLLREVSQLTGGRYFSVDRLDDVPDVAAEIGNQLRNEYVIGYTPSNQTRNGKFRRVSVKVSAPKGCPKLLPAWRTGYFAPL